MRGWRKNSGDAAQAVEGLARWGKAAVRFGLSSLILGFLAYKVSWSQLAEVIGQMHLGLTITAFALLHIGQSFSSWRWKLLAGPLGFGQPYSRFRSLFYIGTFFNLFLPTSIGGDAVRAWKLAEAPVQRLAALGSVIADRVAGVAAMLVMACLVTLLAHPELPDWVLLLPWGAMGGLLCIFLVLPWLAQKLTKFRLLLLGLGWSRGGWKTWWQALGLSFIVQGFSTLQVILLGIALGLPVPWQSYLLVVPLVTLLTMLPLSLNGVGVREGGLFLLLAPYGVTLEQAIALGLGWLALGLGVGLVGGIIYLFFDHSPASTQTLSITHSHNHLGRKSHGSVYCRADEGRAGQRAAAA